LAFGDVYLPAAQTWDQDITIFGVLISFMDGKAYFLSFGQGNRKGGVFERVIYPQGQQRGRRFICTFARFGLG